MTELEKLSLQSAAAEVRYQRSPQARRDLERDIKRRAERDRKLGHLPGCSLTRCVTGCKSSIAHITI